MSYIPLIADTEVIDSAEAMIDELALACWNGDPPTEWFTPPQPRRPVGHTNGASVIEPLNITIHAWRVGDVVEMDW